MATVNTSLYAQHIAECGQVRAALTSMKAIFDQRSTRDSLVLLNAVSQQLIETPYPTNLIGRVESLSESIQALEKTLADIEDAIRGTLLYPVQT